MKKVIFVLGVALGFVIGSRTGRGPYEQLERTARKVADDPRVQDTAQQARDVASRTAREAAETVKDKAPGVAAAAKEKAADAGSAARGAASHVARRADAPKGDASTAPDADTDSRAATEVGTEGGDAEVGDKPLSS